MQQETNFKTLVCGTQRRLSEAALQRCSLKKYSENCDVAVLEIYLDHKFQRPQEGLNCESLTYEVVT